MRGPVLALLAAIGTSAAYSILPLPARGAVSRSSGVRALEADALPAVVSVSDRSVECELCVPIADGAATRTMLITLQSENDASEQAVNLADKIGVEAAELEAELIECWRGAVTPVRKPKRKPRLVRPRAPEDYLARASPAALGAFTGAPGELSAAAYCLGSDVR